MEYFVQESYQPAYLKITQKFYLNFWKIKLPQFLILKWTFIMKSSKRRHCELLNSSGSDGAVVLVVKSVRVQIHRPQTQRITT